MWKRNAEYVTTCIVPGSVLKFPPELSDDLSLHPALLGGWPFQLPIEKENKSSDSDFFNHKKHTNEIWWNMASKKQTK